MQENPTNPPINNWKDHLPKMIGCSYIIEGVEANFYNYDIITENDIIVIYTAARQYQIKHENMPEFLGGWIPLRQEGIPYYNHLLEEQGIKTPITNQLSVTPPAPKPITPEEHLQTLFLDFMRDLIKDGNSMQEKLNTAYQNIKDQKAGNAGEAFVRQANMVANLVDKMIKGKLSAIQGFNMAYKMFGIDKKGKNKEEKDK